MKRRDLFKLAGGAAAAAVIGKAIAKEAPAEPEIATPPNEYGKAKYVEGLRAIQYENQSAVYLFNIDNMSWKRIA